MKQVTDFIIEEREQRGAQYFTLTLRHPSQMQKIVPGQFVEVRVDGCREVMLRRPISVHDVDEECGTLKLLIQIVGRGTRRLAQLGVGERLNLVYPLGNGFDLGVSKGSRVLLVGGGAGSAPLYHLAKELSHRGVRSTILIGGRNAGLIPVRDEFEQFGDLCIATDDGSLGHRGLVTEHPCFAASYDRIYTCGPTPMMKAVAQSALQRGIECYVSLENMMACGVGACLCCVVDTDEGHLCVCKEGPVFNAEKLKKLWNL
ncbi:MAG: dihydroorotate dehydrogenase electron transfer subunit [Bacteroidales bacterium]|nr:dihydroorotate dehydrogenase electron transfer subunit [Bacteroidales bacterium]